jgi:hypothetical protein
VLQRELDTRCLHVCKSDVGKLILPTREYEEPFDI